MSTHSTFVWHELMTTDPVAATAFYTAVIGWKAQDSGMSEVPYTILSVGETPIGGLMELPIDARANGARPGWIGYIGVDDVDACAMRIKDAGGKQHRAPADIPGVGRFAVVADPQGAAFVLFKAASDEMPAPPPMGTPGTIGWNELQATDRDSAFAFYADIFGWTKGEAVDMGQMGIYQLFKTGGESAVGGMMNRMPMLPMPFWAYYISVEEINAAIGRVTAHGGQIVNGPHQVPGGSWIAHGLDPQGAMFALVGPGQVEG